MSAAAATAVRVPSVKPSETLRELALADARRYARHPLFVTGAVLSFGLTAVVVIIDRSAAPLAALIVPAFFLGVFGFVVAHRLTTSLRRSDELVGVLPLDRRRRTLAMCLACGVPFATTVLCTLEAVVLTAAYPPEPPGAPMVWFGQVSWPVVLAAVLAMGPVAGLGGPLLGVVVATWAPFRGSALVGVVLLVVGTTAPAQGSTAAESPSVFWRALPPWSTLVDENAVHGEVVSSTLVPHLSPVWDLVYVTLLCALGVVVALLHEPQGRRPLLWTGAGLLVAAAGALAMTVR